MISRAIRMWRNRPSASWQSGASPTRASAGTHARTGPPRDHRLPRHIPRCTISAFTVASDASHTVHARAKPVAGDDADTNDVETASSPRRSTKVSQTDTPDCLPPKTC